VKSGGLPTLFSVGSGEVRGGSNRYLLYPEDRFSFNKSNVSHAASHKYMGGSRVSQKLLGTSMCLTSHSSSCTHSNMRAASFMGKSGVVG
jgi:hypothetical protein